MPQDLEQVFLSHLADIDRAIDFACRRHGAGESEAEEFSSWVKLRLIEDDYAVLGKFRGKSSLKTYLIVVVQNLFRDYRNQNWGRWRPSATARREGTEGVLLERLISRDGRQLSEAVEILLQNHRVERSRDELLELGGRLLAGRRFRHEPEIPAATGVSEVDTAERVRDAERRETIARTRQVLEAALAELATEDRLILKLHFEDGLPISRIARMLRLEQRPLYDRLPRLLSALRSALEAEGLSYDEVRGFLGWGGSDLDLEMVTEGEMSRRSNQTRAGALEGERG